MSDTESEPEQVETLQKKTKRKPKTVKVQPLGKVEPKTGSKGSIPLVEPVVEPVVEPKTGSKGSIPLVEPVVAPKRVFTQKQLDALALAREKRKQAKEALSTPVPEPVLEPVPEQKAKAPRKPKAPKVSEPTTGSEGSIPEPKAPRKARVPKVEAVPVVQQIDKSWSVFV